MVGYDQYGNKSRAFQIGIYIQEKANIGDLTARSSLRYNYIKTTIDLINGGNTGEPEVGYSNLLWSADLKYKAQPTYIIYASAGIALDTVWIKVPFGIELQWRILRQ